MSWTLTTSGAAIAKAGAGANTTIIASGATLAKWSDQAESTISMRTRHDWVGGYASVPANFKDMLNDLASDLIGIKIISYDMSGYTSRLEAQTMLDVLVDNASKIIADLSKKEYQDVFI